jgi:hypothetical protein
MVCYLEPTCQLSSMTEPSGWSRVANVAQSSGGELRNIGPFLVIGVLLACGIIVMWRTILIVSVLICLAVLFAGLLTLISGAQTLVRHASRAEFYEISNSPGSVPPRTGVPRRPFTSPLFDASLSHNCRRLTLNLGLRRNVRTDQGRLGTVRTSAIARTIQGVCHADKQGAQEPQARAMRYMKQADRRRVPAADRRRGQDNRACGSPTTSTPPASFVHLTNEPLAPGRSTIQADTAVGDNGFVAFDRKGLDPRPPPLGRD